MIISANMDTRSFETTLQGWEKIQLPFATSLALNRVGQTAKTALRGVMQEVFDRPTPYSLNSVMMIPSTKTNLVCEVKLKDLASKGVPPSVYLQPQVAGGNRQAKSSEVLLRRSGFLPDGMFYVPGSGAKLDQYGNMSSGQIVQILSALKSFPETGYLANRSSRQGARANKNATTYFVGKPAGGKLPLGIYQRKANDQLVPLMIFVDSPNYKPRLPFYSTVNAIYTANFQDAFTQALRDALILSPSFAQAA